jgi:Fic family protein
MFDKYSWILPRETSASIGYCEALLYALANAPLTPEVYEDLKKISLKRGALATTAIEGNSISEEEFDKYIARKKAMPPSRQYQQLEVENVLAAFAEVEKIPLDRPLDCDLVRRLHTLIVAGDEEAVPGRFRPGDVTVGGYRPPKYHEVPALMEQYCRWLREFKLSSLLETLPVILAAHVYFEMIHPFMNGNGRTGRMIEYFLLLKTGLPLTAGHILSNHYNQTRDNYYHYLSRVDWNSPGQGLVDFIAYAVQGLRDGLRAALDLVQENQRKVFWQRLVYGRFNEKGGRLSAKDKKRRRNVALNFPVEENAGLSLNEIPAKTGTLDSGALPKNTLNRDLAYLKRLGLLRQGQGKYYANHDLVCPGC